MNILMMTNTYLPHVGGVARSVASFTTQFRKLGHQVLVVAPMFDGCSRVEEGVIRVPALQNFNGSDFSVRLAIPGYLAGELKDFKPDVIHSHHPFLLGDTALRIASSRALPVVFTHHTMYEQYTHYVPGDSDAMQRFVIRMATDYANLCDHIIAPSESIAAVLRKRGVNTGITAIPTGIDKNKFATGDGAAARRKYDIPKEAFVVGHVGRLALEKNLDFLSRAVARFVRERPDAYFLVVGKGAADAAIRSNFEAAGLGDRLRLTGSLGGADLTNVYHAMNVFAFASKSETQGMVLAESMTAGIPVVAIDAPGAREVVRDERNGYLLMDEHEQEFADALDRLATLGENDRNRFAEHALRTAEEFSLERCADRLIEVYAELIESDFAPGDVDQSGWAQTLRLIETEWNLWTTRAEAAVESISESL